MRLNNQYGFTLIEILVVVVILVLLAGVVAPASIKLVSKFDQYLQQKETAALKHKAVFYEFVTESNCEVKDEAVVCE